MGFQDVVEHGLFIIDDQYFADFPSVRHMDNKHENRPYYLAVKGEHGIFWLVPISHMVDKYRAKMQADKKKYGDSIFYYIGRLKGEERAFLTGNIIPVTEPYIKKPFTIKGTPYVIRDKTDIKQIQSKVRRYIALVRNRKLFPAVDILGIERKLMNRS